MLSFIQFFTFKRQVVVFFASLILGLVLQFTWGFAWSWMPFLIVIGLGIKHLLLGSVNAAAMEMQMGNWTEAENLLKYTFKPSWLRMGYHGMYYLVLSRIAFEKQDVAQAEKLSSHALSLDLPDDMKAMVYLQLTAIAGQRQQRGKIEEYYRQLKKLNITQPMVREQVKQLGDMLDGKHPEQQKMMKQQMKQQQNFMSRRRR